MPAQIVTYAGLRAGVSAWLARSGDTLLESRFDDFLLNCERRIYYGHATEDAANPLRSDPLRIVEMETVDAAFALQESVAQPPDFLELISAVLNGPRTPLEIVSQRTLDGYGMQSLGGPRRIAVSGTRFRVKDDPAGAAATLRYYRRLATPEGSTVNDILTAYPESICSAAWSRRRSSPRARPRRSATCRSTTPAWPASMRAPSASLPPPRRSSACAQE